MHSIRFHTGGLKTQGNIFLYSYVVQKKFWEHLWNDYMALTRCCKRNLSLRRIQQCRKDRIWSLCHPAGGASSRKKWRKIKIIEISFFLIFCENVSKNNLISEKTWIDIFKICTYFHTVQNISRSQFKLHRSLNVSVCFTLVTEFM